MNAIVRNLDARAFRQLLEFAQDCGYASFTLRRPRGGTSRSSNLVRDRFAPFRTEQQIGSAALGLTASLNAQTAALLAAMLTDKSARDEETVSLSFRNLLEIILPAGSAHLQLSDFQAEALFRRGVVFEFRSREQDGWTKFESKHALIAAPSELSLRSNEFDSERWNQFGVSSHSELGTSGTESHGTKWVIARRRAPTGRESSGLGAALGGDRVAVPEAPQTRHRRPARPLNVPRWSARMALNSSKDPLPAGNKRRRMPKLAPADATSFIQGGAAHQHERFVSQKMPFLRLLTELVS